MSWRDWTAAGLLALVVGGAATWRSSQLDSVLYRYPDGINDVYFDADLPRICSQMSDRFSREHLTTSRHPLGAALTYLPAELGRRLTHAPTQSVIHVLVGIAAFAWAMTFFALLRLISLRLVDAVIFTAVGAVSASSMFWMAVPESFLLGSITMLIPLAVTAKQSAGTRVSERAFIAASAISLSVTVTNWMAGLLAAWVAHPWRRATQISANAFAIVALLWFAQRWWFPMTLPFVEVDGGLVVAVHPTRVLAVIATFFSHSIVMPQIGILDEVSWRGLTVQGSSLGSSGTLGVLATVLWLALLALGTAAMLSSNGAWRSVRLLLAATIAGQLALHLAVGEETFLYAMHFGPLLVAVAAHACLGRWRAYGLAIAVALTIAALVNNTRQFNFAAAEIRQLAADTGALGAADAIDALALQ